MTKSKKSPMCRKLTNSSLKKAMLTSMYQRSQHTEVETIQAVCRTRKGEHFIMPYREETGKDKSFFVFTTGMWVQNYGDPCSLADSKMVGTVHTHPNWSNAKYFSAPDLATMDPKHDKDGCIVYRKGDEVRLKCIELKAKKPWVEVDPIFEEARKSREKDYEDALDTRNIFEPEVDHPKLWDYFSKPCDVKVSKGEIRTQRLPWRQF